MCETTADYVGRREKTDVVFRDTNGSAFTTVVVRGPTEERRVK